MSASARRVVFGLGSNLGDREATLRCGVDGLRRLPGVERWALSSLYETMPVGGPPQGRYLNAAALVITNLPPQTLLEGALRIEAQHGRVRLERFGPRTLDIDVLWIEGERVETPSLGVPHPRLTERGFALVPLLEVAPDARDPRTGEPLAVAMVGLDLGGVVRVKPRGAWGGEARGALLDTQRPQC